MSVVRHLAKVGCSDPNERHSKEQSSRTFTSSPHVAYCNSHRPGKGWHEVRVLIFRKQYSDFRNHAIPSQLAIALPQRGPSFMYTAQTLRPSLIAMNV